MEISGRTDTNIVIEVKRAQIASAIIRLKQRIRIAANIALKLPSVSAKTCRYKAYLF